MAVAYSKGCKLIVDGETLEISSPLSSTFRQFIAGRKSWKMSCDVMIMTAASIKTFAGMVNTSYTVRMGDTYGTPADGVSGTAICTKFDVTANTGSLVKGSFEFTGSGPLT